MNFRMILRCPVGDPVGINVINFHQLPTSGSFFSLSFFEVWGDSNLGLLDSPILEKIRRTSIHQSLNGTLPTDP